MVSGIVNLPRPIWDRVGSPGLGVVGQTLHQWSSLKSTDASSEPRYGRFTRRINVPCHKERAVVGGGRETHVMAFNGT